MPFGTGLKSNTKLDTNWEVANDLVVAGGAGTKAGLPRSRAGYGAQFKWVPAARFWSSKTKP